jgi:hypothetical protein
VLVLAGSDVRNVAPASATTRSIRRFVVGLLLNCFVDARRSALFPSVICSASFEKASQLCTKKGWEFPIFSSGGTTFNQDLGVSPQAGHEKEKEYNYGKSVWFGPQAPGKLCPLSGSPSLPRRASAADEFLSRFFKKTQGPAPSSRMARETSTIRIRRTLGMSSQPFARRSLTCFFSKRPLGPQRDVWLDRHAAW